MYSYPPTGLTTKTESPEINFHIYGQLIFKKGTKTIQWGKENLCKTWCWETEYLMLKNKIGPLSYIIYKNQLIMEQ